MLHNAVVLYRRTITFSYIVSTNHNSRLRIPSVPPGARETSWDFPEVGPDGDDGDDSEEDEPIVKSRLTGAKDAAEEFQSRSERRSAW